MREEGGNDGGGKLRWLATARSGYRSGLGFGRAWEFAFTCRLHRVRADFISMSQPANRQTDPERATASKLSQVLYLLLVHVFVNSPTCKLDHQLLSHTYGENDRLLHATLSKEGR